MTIINEAKIDAQFRSTATEHIQLSTEAQSLTTHYFERKIFKERLRTHPASLFVTKP